MFRGVHHVAFSTPDLDRFIDHYRRWFGFEEVFRGEWEVGNARVDAIVGLRDSSCRYAQLRLGNLYVEVFQYQTPEGHAVRPRMCDHGIIHMCLYCDDVRAEYARLSALGMTFNSYPGDGPTRGTYGRDCDGNVIEILEIADPDNEFRFEELERLGSE